MRISRVVIRNFRSFEYLDVPLSAGTTCLIGENNTGKSNFLHAIRLCIDAGLSSTNRSLIRLRCFASAPGPCSHRNTCSEPKGEFALRKAHRDPPA